MLNSRVLINVSVLCSLLELGLSFSRRVRLVVVSVILGLW